MSGSDLSNATPPPSDRGSSSLAKSLSPRFVVQFWGVRGSIPTPGLETARYGGNTPCVEMYVAGKRLIFDGGTGLRILGKHLRKEMPVEAHLFFTHTHWERIQGFPFFSPAFVPGNCFHIYGAMGPNGASIKQRLSEQMLRPNFPVPLQMMQSDLKFVDITPGSLITLDDVVVETVSLNRSTGALGYRVTWDGHSVVYATDTERSPDHLDQIDQSLMYLAEQADLLIYDVAYSEQVYLDPDAAAGQQSDAWQLGIEVAIAAHVKTMVMFHHDPSHNDDFLDHVELDVQSRFRHVQLAREGMMIDVLKTAAADPQ